jgi:hypothetical protein
MSLKKHVTPSLYVEWKAQTDNFQLYVIQTYMELTNQYKIPVFISKSVF